MLSAARSLSFIVHNEKSTDSDSFDWQPQITRGDNGELLTDAKKDFCGSHRWPISAVKSLSSPSASSRKCSS